ncbi:MAG: hypothetical protein QHH14_12895 [Clostridiales bacterium]|nr:hypothetical protein [Clostridiales bacterium]
MNQEKILCFEHFLDETVDFGKQVGDSLDFVDDDPVPVADGDEAFKPLGIRYEPDEKLGFQQIDVDSTANVRRTRVVFAVPRLSFLADSLLQFP